MRKTLLAMLGASACALMLAVPMVAAQQKANAPRSAWAPENLTGRIDLVDPALHVVVVKGPGGVPFDIDVTQATRIQSGGQSMKLQDLARDTGKQVSVRFTPARRGDVAESIQVSS
jgi:hypothetical protein